MRFELEYQLINYYLTKPCNFGFRMVLIKIYKMYIIWIRIYIYFI
jgi:hypothetical protein